MHNAPNHRPRKRFGQNFLHNPGSIGRILAAVAPRPGEHLVEIGRADVKRTGQDVTVLAYGRPVHAALAAAGELEQAGVDVEVVDLRSLRPLEEEAIVASVGKTKRCVVVDEAWPICGVGSYVGWLVSHRCFDVLDAQVELVASADVPMPYNHALELAAQPSPEKIHRMNTCTVNMRPS